MTALSNLNTPTFSGAGGTATGDSSTVTVKVYSGTGTGGALVESLNATVSGGNYSVAASPALADGTYTAQASQSDAAGNVGTSGTTTFTIDTHVPTASGLAVAPSPTNAAPAINASVKRCDQRQTATSWPPNTSSIPRWARPGTGTPLSGSFTGPHSQRKRVHSLPEEASRF